MMPKILPKANRRWKNGFSPLLWRSRNIIERMFCRLKDFGRVATCYDRLATNVLAAVLAVRPDQEGDINVLQVMSERVP